MAKIISTTGLTNSLNKIKSYIQSKLSSLVINSDLIADGAITTSKIGGGAITQDKIASDVSFLDNSILELGHIKDNYINNQAYGTVYVTVTISKYCYTKDILFKIFIWETNNTLLIKLKVKYLYNNAEGYYEFSCGNVANKSYNEYIFKVIYNNGSPTIYKFIGSSLTTYTTISSAIVSTTILARVSTSNLNYPTGDTPAIDN